MSTCRPQSPAASPASQRSRPTLARSVRARLALLLTHRGKATLIAANGISALGRMRSAGGAEAQRTEGTTRQCIPMPGALHVQVWRGRCSLASSCVVALVSPFQS